MGNPKVVVFPQWIWFLLLLPVTSAHSTFQPHLHHRINADGRNGKNLAEYRRLNVDNRKHISIIGQRKETSNTSLVKINALMFLFYCTLGSAHPFIPMFYRRLGISDSLIGLLGAITPAVTFFVSPIWGAFADQTG